MVVEIKDFVAGDNPPRRNLSPSSNTLSRQPGNPSLQSTLEPVPAYTSSRPRLILADDNSDMRTYVERILSEHGYLVEAVSNGAAALAAVQNGPLPELILSDVMMPEMDGFELLRAVRANAVTRGHMRPHAAWW
jgi:PleD family two-component response regulator